MINIHAVPALKDNYIWVLSSSNGKALVIDPGDAKPVLKFLQEQNLSLAGILITHHHWDHSNGIAELRQHHTVPVFGPAQLTSGLTHVVKENEICEIADFPITFKVLTIPGHTLSHVAYYSPGILFCGDTLFSSGCGRVFEGTMAQMYDSLNKIKSLPDNTEIYCAHEYTLNNLRFASLVEPSNEDIIKRMQEVSKLRDDNLPSIPSFLSEEKRTNPFLRCDVKEVITSAEKFAGHKLNDPVEVFAAIRKWKDGF